MGLIFRLLVLLVLVSIGVPTLLHAERGAPWDKAFQAALVDVQVIPSCPDRAGDAWRFLTRGEVTLSATQARAAYCDEGAYAAPAGAGEPVASAASPTPTLQPGAAPVRTATPAAGSTVSATHPTPISPTSSVPEARLQIWREYMLQLINKDRQDNGLQPVTLGDNAAAQAHAEDLFSNKYLSHWGLDGLKPYMRYTLAGGAGYAAENVSGEPCPRDQDATYRKTPIFEELEQDQAGLMNSPGHRANILNPWHKTVNLGIVCDDVGCAVAQLFEAEYVAWTAVPTLDRGVLRMAGSLTDEFKLTNAQVWYDEASHTLTFGQVGRTYSYSLGQRPAVFLREPPSPGYFYTDDSTQYSWSHGVDPYTVDPAVERPQRVQKGDVIACSEWPREKIDETARVPLITTDSWKGTGGSFFIQADIGQVLNDLGPGVYTVVLWGEKDGKDLALTNYSLFVQ